MGFEGKVNTKKMRCQNELHISLFYEYKEGDEIYINDIESGILKKGKITKIENKDTEITAYEITFVYPKAKKTYSTKEFEDLKPCHVLVILFMHFILNILFDWLKIIIQNFFSEGYFLSNEPINAGIQNLARFTRFDTDGSEFLDEDEIKAALNDLITKDLFTVLLLFF